MRFSFAILLFAASLVQTVRADYAVTRLTNVDGLSNSSVTSVFQDREGLMWFGTWDGLNLYNSREFRVYKPEPDNPHSISNNIIRAVVEDDRGGLWVATDRGVDRLDRRSNRFRHYVTHPGGQQPLVEKAYLLARNRSGVLLLSVCGEGLFRFDEEEDRFVALRPDKDWQAEQLFFDRDDRLWVHTRDRRLLWLQLTPDGTGTGEWQELLLPSGRATVEAVFYDRGGHRLYPASGGGTLFVYDIAGQAFEPHGLPLPDDGRPNAMLFADGRVFYGTNDGLYRLSLSDRRFEPLLTDTPVLSLCAGSQQMIWVGTDMQGVCVLTPRRNDFRSFTAGNVAGFGRNAVRCFAEVGEDELWVGTKGDGIFVFDRSDGRTNARVVRRLTTADGLLNNSVYTICDGGRNEYWIGTDGEGLNYLDRQSRQLYTLQVPEAWRGAVRLSSVYSILPDGADTLWVGTSGRGMYRLEIDRSRHPYTLRAYRQYVYDPQADGSLTNNIIYSVIAEDDRRLWIGTRGGGLNLFDKAGGRFTAYRFSSDSLNNLSNDDILSLLRDREGSLWVGTSLGLNKMERQPDGRVSFRHFTRQDGLSNNTIHGILQDNEGNLWISTNRGLGKVVKTDTGDCRIISYFRKDGLQNDEFADGAYYKSPASGELYFGGVGGFNAFHPRQITDNSYMPHLLLDAFYVQNTETRLDTHLERRGGVETLVLDHGMKSISFRFVPVDYVSGEKCETAYKLEGYNDDWVYLGTSSTIVLSNLSTGRYTLRVRNSNAAKAWNESCFTLPIVMRPPWWAAWWAWVVYAVVLALAVWAVQWQVSYRLKVRRAIKLKELEKQRLEDIHQAKLRFFTNIAHEFSNSLTLIYGPCEQLMKYSDRPEIRKYVRTIRSNSQRMQSLISQLIEFRKAETGHLTIAIEPVDVVELVRYVVDNFIERLEQKHIGLSVGFGQNPLTWNTDRDGLEKVLFNLVSNAVKYTPQGENIEVEVSVREDSLYLAVKNTGVGIKQAGANSIFDRFKVLERFEAQVSEGFEPRSGIGLALCRNIVEMLKGTIEVESDGDTYTLFRVCLPVLQADVRLSGEEKTATRPPVPLPDEVEPLSEADDAVPDISSDKLVLVVDDERDIRLLLRDILSEHFDIMEAADGREALEAVRRRMPQLVVCDVVMPVMNGIDFLRAMREDELTRHIPIVLLSSRSSVESQIEGLETGADAYLPKPFHPRHLQVLVDGLIHRKQVITEYSRSYYAGVESFNSKVIHKENKDLLIAVHRIIGENVDMDGLSPEFIANELALSKMQLYRKVKEMTGETPTELIRSIRLETAAKLLVTTNKTVQEVMFGAGFNNKAYFFREFSKKYGLTPKEYRTRKQQP